MRHIPSLKTLRAVFGQQFQHDYGVTAKNELLYLRDRLTMWRDGEISSRSLMESTNKALQGHGIEYLESENERARAYYVNMGDTYNATLVLDIPKNRIWATDWGTWVEAEERRGNKFA